MSLETHLFDLYCPAQFLKPVRDFCFTVFSRMTDRTPVAKSSTQSIYPSSRHLIHQGHDFACPSRDVLPEWSLVRVNFQTPLTSHIITAMCSIRPNPWHQLLAESAPPRARIEPCPGLCPLWRVHGRAAIQSLTPVIWQGQREDVRPVVEWCAVNNDRSIRQVARFRRSSSRQAQFVLVLLLTRFHWFVSLRAFGWVVAAGAWCSQVGAQCQGEVVVRSR